MRYVTLLLASYLFGVAVLPTPSTSQEIRIEAESGQLNGFSTLLGGTFIEAEIDDPTATYTFPGTDGTYAVTVRYCDEDDGASSYELIGSAAGVIAAWAGDQPTGATLCSPEARLVRTVATSVELHNGETITFACQQDLDEPCRVDYFAFTYVSPPPPPGDIRIEAESGQLNGFSTLLGGTFIDAEVSNPTATYTFLGADGTYAVVVRYCDEDDGTSSYELSGSTAGTFATWNGDQPTGSTLCSPEARLIRTVATSVSLINGETITFACQRDSGEPCRVDYFDLVDVGDRAFPGAIGYGSLASGARGLTAEVCVVTNLNDAGAGSFRACAEQATPAYITFAVSGYVDLVSGEVDIAADKTIECATAPGDGVVFRKSRLHVADDNVILRGCKTWPGSEPGGQALNVRDGIVVGNANQVVENAMVANNSMLFATDENSGTWFPVKNVTFQQNIIAWAIDDSGEGDSLGMLISNGPDKVTVVENLLAFNFHRNPSVNSLAQPIEIVNNLVYCYGENGTQIRLGSTAMHVIGNRYKKACAPINAPAIKLRDGSIAYTDDNTMNDGSPAMVDPDGSSAQVDDPLFSSTITPRPSHEVEGLVLSKAGPADRISFEVEAIQHYVDGTGDFIDSVDDIGGWPPLQGGTNPPDSDGDNMPDWWEASHCGGSCAPTDDQDDDGYENIEEWFHSFYSAP